MLSIMILNIITYALILAIVSIGLSLFLGLLNIVNNAHGAIYIIGSYFGYTLIYSLGLNFFLAIPLIVIIGVIFGMGIWMLTVKPLMSGEFTIPMLATYGAAIATIEVIKIIWTPYALPLEPPHILKGLVPIGSYGYPVYRLFVMVMGILVLIFLYIFFERTNIGIMVRASLEDRNMAEAMGVNVDRVQLITFLLASGLASLAGLLAAPILTVYYEVAWEILLFSFVVTVLGGVGCMSGTVLAAFLISAIINITAIFSPPLSKASAFMLLFIALVIRPRGILGKGR
jgi:branched-chain amino acid transport system permease protein